MEQPEISWYLNNQIISNDSILQLESVEESNVYICNAQNEAGIAQKIFYVNAVTIPRILSHFDDIIILTNQTRILQCEADGIPAPNIHWTGISEGDTVDSTISNDEILHLNSSMSSGRYLCIAENIVGKAEVSVNVKIINKPK